MPPLCFCGFKILRSANPISLRFVVPVLFAALGFLSGCASVVSSATNGLASNLSTAILNQNDPQTVREGAPAFLLMLDGFAESSPQDPAMLAAAAELYAAYGVLFVEDPERARRLTQRSRGYAERALCASNENGCGIAPVPFKEYENALQNLRKKDVAALYTFSLAWLADIQARAGDMSAMSQLPRAEAALRRVEVLDPSYREADVAHYLGVLSTIRPPALGGQFEQGRAYFERAIALTDGQDLSVKVDFARYYARTLYERDLHDQLLEQVLDSDPVVPNLTLTNTLAQLAAAELLLSADDYF